MKLNFQSITLGSSSSELKFSNQVDIICKTIPEIGLGPHGLLVIDDFPMTKRKLDDR